MSPLLVSTFLALLTLLAAGGVLLVAIGSIAARLGAGQELFDRLRATLSPASLWLILLVTATATVGSLYFSNVAGFEPCVLCWYQRIAMYPLVLLSGLAALRSDLGIRRYIGAMAGVGALISAYHIAVQRLPGVPHGACSLDVPCDLIYVERFGFITIPVMALVAFLSILTIVVASSPFVPSEPGDH